MFDLRNAIASRLKVILNQKCCPKCMSVYSNKTALFEVYEFLKSKSTVFAASEFGPVYSREGSVNRTVCCPTTFRELEPSVGICITCNCGYCSYMGVSNQ